MPEQNDPAKDPSGPWEGWRNDPIVEPAPGWLVDVHQVPSFTFTSPEGQKYTVNGPDGATSEQAFAILQGWIAGNQKAEAPSAEHGPWENYRPPASAGDSRFKVDPGGVLSEFEAAVLEECIAEAMSTPSRSTPVQRRRTTVRMTDFALGSQGPACSWAAGQVGRPSCSQESNEPS